MFVSSLIRRTILLSLLVIVSITLVVPSLTSARDPYPRKVRIKNDNGNIQWAIDPPGVYGSLYAPTRLIDTLSSGDRAVYCPTADQSSTPWKCDCFFQPFGPINEWVKIQRSANALGDQCYAPPYSTGGGWWNWLVTRMENKKAGRETILNQIPAINTYLGIDGECRALKSGDGWSAVGVNLAGQFNSQYVPTVIDKVKSLYPGKTIRPHMDPGFKDLYLEKEVDFHRESLEADQGQGYLYKGLQFSGMGYWQGFADYYWVTNTQGLNPDWWPFYLASLAALSMHTDSVTGGNSPGEGTNQQFIDFIKGYTGRDIRDTPGVWIHLRETLHTKEAGDNASGKYGDYDFYLYRPENLGGNQTVPVTARDIAAINPQVTSQIYQYLTGPIGRPNRSVGRKVASGSRFMSFDIDDGYGARYSGQSGVSYGFRIVYFDQGTDTFKLQYKNGSNQWQEKPFTKTNTNLWKEGTVTVADAVFNNGASEGENADLYPTDFRLDFGSAPGTVIHLVEVRANGGTAREETRPKAQVAVDLVRDRADEPRRGMYSVGLNQTIWVKATLQDSQRNPIPNERITFAYNTEWNIAKSAVTDANGVAFMDFNTANRLDSSGFVGGGGTTYKASSYSIQAYFPGSDHYQPSRNDAKLWVTDSPSPTDQRNLRVDITNISEVQADGKVKVTFQLYSPNGPVGTPEDTLLGRNDGFYADDPNAQTISILTRAHPNGYFMASNHVTLKGTSNVLPSRVQNVQAVSGPGGDQMTLTWSSNPEADIAGYRIFYGTASGSYPKVFGVGRTTTATISGLEPGRTYYFAVAAHNVRAYEGDWSREVSQAVGNASIILVVQKSGAGSGTVTGNGINCGDDCLEAYASAGANVNLTVAAASGSTFAGWSGACTGTGSCTVTMNAGRTVTAQFNSSSPNPNTYTITASAGSGGTVNPSGAVSVTSGGSKTITITPNSGYAISDVNVDGVSRGAISPYTFTNVTANHTLAATFNTSGSSATSYTVTTSVSGGGTINPSGTVTVSNGGSKTFAMTPNAGYRIADVLADGVSQGALSSYSFSNVTANHTLDASFVQEGSGSGDGNVVFAVNCGGLAYRDKTGVMYMADTETSGKTYNTTSPIDCTEDDLLYQSERWGNFSYSIPVANGSYSVTLKLAELYESAAGRRVFSVKMEGKEVITNLDLFATVGKNKAYDVTSQVAVSDGVLNIEFYSPKGDAKVNAILVISPQASKQFRITASAGTGGAVSPSGAFNVTQGGQKAFTLTPNSGYYIADVKVDGVSKGAVSTYTFSNVISDHILTVVFKALSNNQYALTVNQAGTGSGTVAANPSGIVFNAGTGVTLTVTADAGSAFAGWSGACSGSSLTCAVTMNGNKDVTATFNLDENGVASYKTGQRGVVVDLDGNGKNDVVWFHEQTGHVYAWYLNEASFKDLQFVRNVAQPNWRMVGGGNGRTDGSYQIFWHNETTGEVYAWHMEHENFIREEYLRLVEDTRWKLAGVGDLNGDGRVDLIWHHQGSGDVYVWFMNGTEFVRDQYIRTVEDTRWQVVGIGDFNRDGKADIVWQHQETGAVYVWYMDGAAFVGDQFVRNVEDLEWKVVGIGKFNGAGNSDILWRHDKTGEVYIWHMDGAVYTGDERMVPRTSLTVADFNGDQNGDFVFHDPSTGKVSLWYMNGAQVLQEQGLKTVNDLRWKVVGTGSFAGDRNVDILWHHQGTGDVYVWFTEGGKFSSDQKVATVSDPNWRVVGVGDVNKDGRSDIVWQHQVSGDVYVWYMDGVRFMKDEYVGNVSDLDWKVVAVGDLDGDGHPDLLWKNQVSGEVYIWHMNGARFIHEQAIRAGVDKQWEVDGLLQTGGKDQTSIIWRNQGTGDVRAWELSGSRYVREQLIRTIQLPK